MRRHTPTISSLYQSMRTEATLNTHIRTGNGRVLVVVTGQRTNSATRQMHLIVDATMVVNFMSIRFFGFSWWWGCGGIIDCT